jgi:hypothetical protein
MSATYPEQDLESLDGHYIRHVGAMTRERLHEKSEIAEQLAVRDRMLDDLLAEYRDRRAQWGKECLWEKHEDTDAIKRVEKFVKETQR